MSAPDWIRTYTGQQFNYSHLEIERIDIRDIAHSLSQQCRFGGHCLRFYSVAQHCVFVSQLVPPEYKLWGLLHDAPETYICDITSPFKNTKWMEGYRAFEQKIEICVFTRFGLISKHQPWLGIPSPVKRADWQAVVTEGKQLLSKGVKGWADESEAADVMINPMNSRDAERAFLEEFDSWYDTTRIL